MMQSPFAFYRGAAAIMAADLAPTPASGIRVQACGDCHLMNFGGFATPERRIIFDINDFDETLPAPWEWDVKRLAASFVLAAQQRLQRRPTRATLAARCVRSYRERMHEFAAMRRAGAVVRAHRRRRSHRDAARDREVDEAGSQEHIDKAASRVGASSTISRS